MYVNHIFSAFLNHHHHHHHSGEGKSDIVFKREREKVGSCREKVSEECLILPLFLTIQGAHNTHWFARPF
jgi:hypothetical protein